MISTYFHFSFLQISHLSTCACLSDKSIYPTFFRTVPSDQFQILALVQLMKNFGWQWVGIIHSVEVYASDGVAEFIKKVKAEGICVEYVTSFNKYTNMTHKVTEKLKASTSNVVLLYMSLSYVGELLKIVGGNNVPRKQWIGSEAWISQIDLASLGSKNILHGAMGFALPQSNIPGLAEFLLSLKPTDEPDSVMIKAFWESFFDCSFSPSTNTTKICTGDEDLRTISSAYTNTELRSVRNVYAAVYSIAHALDALLQCENGSNPTTGKQCVNKMDVQPKQVQYGQTNI